MFCEYFLWYLEGKAMKTLEKLNRSENGKQSPVTLVSKRQLQGLFFVVAVVVFSSKIPLDI